MKDVTRDSLVLCTATWKLRWKPKVLWFLRPVLISRRSKVYGSLDREQDRKDAFENSDTTWSKSKELWLAHRLGSHNGSKVFLKSQLNFCSQFSSNKWNMCVNRIDKIETFEHRFPR